MDYSDLDIQDIEDLPRPDDAPGPASAFFCDTFPEVFPDICRQELFDFFRFVMHSHRRCFDTPAKSPKNEEVESAIRNKGRKGCCTFERATEYGKDRFIVQPVRAWMFDATQRGRKHYYTSGTRTALVMFDVDGHKAYQTRETTRAALGIIEAAFRAVLGTAPSFVASGRGENGYALLNLRGVKPAAANQVLLDLQVAVRHLLARHDNLADFEIKGTITWTDAAGTLHAGVYGKLPTCSPDWSYQWFDEFRRSRTLTLADLKRVITHINAQVTDADRRRHARLQHEAITAHYLPVPPGQRWRLTADLGNAWEAFTLKYRGREWVAKRQLTTTLLNRVWRDYSPEPLVVPDVEGVAEPVQDVAQQVFHDLDKPKEKRGQRSRTRVGTTPPRRSSMPLPVLRDEPDSYKRQRDALLALARSLGRVPTVPEALDYIEANDLYTGRWAENQAGRERRVASILKAVARTFDPAKCKAKTADSARLHGWFAANAGKYDAWAKAKFPDGITAMYKRHVDDEGPVRDQWVRLSASFIATFVAVCEFAVVQGGNPDGSFPEDRAEAIWRLLRASGWASVQFCPRKWAACREAMHAHGVVDVFDREYHTGKAMKWRAGQYLPGLGLWKTKREPSRRDPVSLAEFGMMFMERRREELNPFLRQQAVRTAETSILPPIRPPPTTCGG